MTVPAWLPCTGTVVFILLLFFEKGEATTCRSGDCNKGLIITGGTVSRRDVEVFPANAACTIPPFPQPGRYCHSLSVTNDTLVACGDGSRSGTSCISWKRDQGNWEDFHTLNQERQDHAAVVVDGEDQIIILGGWSSSSQTT